MECGSVLPLSSGSGGAAAVSPVHPAHPTAGAALPHSKAGAALPRSGSFPFRRLGAVVGGDDVAHQAVAHHVALAEVAEADAVDALQDLHGVLEAGGLA